MFCVKIAVPVIIEVARHPRAVVEKPVPESADQAQVGEGVKVVAARADGIKPNETREVADNLRRKLGSGVVVLGRAQDDKASLLVAVTEDLTDRLSAGDLVRELARMIGGGGGGRKDLAEAGGRDPARLDEALAAAPGLVRSRLEVDD